MLGWNNVATARETHACFEFVGLLLFALLVVFEILEHCHTKHEGLYKILAIASFALAVTCELVAFPYGRRADALGEKHESGLEKRLTQVEFEYNQATNALYEATNVVNNANLDVLKNSARHLNSNQQAQLLETIKLFPALTVRGCFPPDVPDALGLLNSIGSVFFSAGWKDGGAANWGMVVGLPNGVIVESTENNGALIDQIAKTLNSMGMATTAFTNAFFPQNPGFFRERLAKSNEVVIAISYRPQAP